MVSELDIGEGEAGGGGTINISAILLPLIRSGSRCGDVEGDG